MKGSVYRELYAAIMECDVCAKIERVRRLRSAWSEGLLDTSCSQAAQDIDDPGRPATPRLVDPRKVPQRTLATAEGRIVMLHSFAHIEFNAINLALDAAYRFREMPDDFISDWIRVAVEESDHFSMLDEYLRDLGSHYGAFNAHNGLWDMVCKTRHDVLHRMALVPRVMEARGLDVTPGLMERFLQAGDHRATRILEVIYREEVGHVAIGNRWYQYCCRQRGLVPGETFRNLINQYFSGKLRGPFNWPARIEAGFDEEELAALERVL